MSAPSWPGVEPDSISDVRGHGTAAPTAVALARKSHMSMESTLISVFRFLLVPQQTQNTKERVAWRGVGVGARVGGRVLE